MKTQRVVLKQDIVIPAGTVFESCDGRTSRYISGNFEATIGLSKDSSGSLIYGVALEDPECAKWFEVAS